MRRHPPGERRRHPWSLADEEEGREREHEESDGDAAEHRDVVLDGGGLAPAVQQHGADDERQQGAQVPHADADAADAAAVLVRADLGEQRVVEDQPRLEADHRDHEQEEREALRGLGEEEGRADAQDGGDDEEREPARRLVGDGAEDRRQDEDDGRGDGGECPDRAVGVLVSEPVLHQPREVERDDTQAEAGVREVVEHPARDAPAGDAMRSRAGVHPEGVDRGRSSSHRQSAPTGSAGQRRRTANRTTR